MQLTQRVNIFSEPQRGRIKYFLKMIRIYAYPEFRDEDCANADAELERSE
jgi:hypothetical protein